MSTEGITRAEFLKEANKRIGKSGSDLFARYGVKTHWCMMQVYYLMHDVCGISEFPKTFSCSGFTATSFAKKRLNYDLTRLEAGDRASLAEVVDSGAKNIFEFRSLDDLKALNSSGTWNNNAYTVSGVTFTVDTTNKTIATSGTSTAMISFVIDAYSTATTKFAGYVLSGCPTGGNYDTGYYMYTTDASSNTKDKDLGEGCIIGSSAISRIRIGCRSGVNMSSKTFKPMLCTKAAFGVSQKFVPYRPNWDLVGKLAVPIIIEKQVSIANSLIDTGVTYTLPANGYYRITAYQKYNNNAPATIAIVNNQNADPLVDTGVYAITETPYPENSYMRALSASTIVKTGSTVETLYVFAKARGSTAKNNIIALVIEPLN